MDLRVLDESNHLGAFAGQLGMTFDTMDGDGVVARWEAAPSLHQPYGIVHGGVHCTVVETLGSIAGALWLGERGQVVGCRTSPPHPPDRSLHATRSGGVCTCGGPSGSEGRAQPGRSSHHARPRRHPVAWCRTASWSSSPRTSNRPYMPST